MKAINWRNGTGAGTLHEGETIEGNYFVIFSFHRMLTSLIVSERLHFMCEHFTEIDTILSGKRNVNLPPITDTLDDDELATHYEGLEELEALDEEMRNDELAENNIEFNTRPQSPRSQSPVADIVQPKQKRQKTMQSSGPVNALIEMQDKRMESENYRTDKKMEVLKDKVNLKREKLEIEKRKENFFIEMEKRKLEMEERKLALEENQIAEENKVRKLELQVNYDLAKAKLESEERMKRLELELIHKNKQ